MPHESPGSYRRRRSRPLVKCIVVCVVLNALGRVSGGPQLNLPFRLPGFINSALAPIHQLPIPSSIQPGQQIINTGLEFGRNHRRIVLPHLYRVGGPDPHSNSHDQTFPSRNPNPQSQPQGQPSNNQPFIIAMSHPIFPIHPLPNNLKDSQPPAAPTVPPHLIYPNGHSPTFVQHQATSHLHSLRERNDVQNAEVVKQQLQENVYEKPTYSHAHSWSPAQLLPSKHETQPTPTRNPSHNLDHAKIPENVFYTPHNFEAPKVQLVEITKAKMLEPPKMKHFLNSLFPNMDQASSPSIEHRQVIQNPPPPPLPPHAPARLQHFVLPAVEHFEQPSAQLHMSLQPKIHQQILPFENPMILHTIPTIPALAEHPGPAQSPSPLTFYSKSPLLHPNTPYLITFKQPHVLVPVQEGPDSTTAAMELAPLEISTPIPTSESSTSNPNLEISTTVSELTQDVKISEITSSSISSTTVAPSTATPTLEDLANALMAEGGESIDQRIKTLEAAVGIQHENQDQSAASTLQIPHTKLTKEHFEMVAEKIANLKNMFFTTTQEAIPAPQNSNAQIPAAAEATVTAATTTTTSSTEKLVESLKVNADIANSTNLNTITEKPVGNVSNGEQIVVFRSRLDSLPLGKRFGQMNSVTGKGELEDYEEDENEIMKNTTQGFGIRMPNPSTKTNVNATLAAVNVTGNEIRISTLEPPVEILTTPTKLLVTSPAILPATNAVENKDGSDVSKSESSNLEFLSTTEHISNTTARTNPSTQNTQTIPILITSSTTEESILISTPFAALDNSTIGGSTTPVILSSMQTTAASPTNISSLDLDAEATAETAAVFSSSIPEVLFDAGIEIVATMGPEITSSAIPPSNPQIPPRSVKKDTESEIRPSPTATGPGAAMIRDLLAQFKSKPISTSAEIPEIYTQNKYIRNGTNKKVPSTPGSLPASATLVSSAAPITIAAIQGSASLQNVTAEIIAQNTNSTADTFQISNIPPKISPSMKKSNFSSPPSFEAPGQELIRKLLSDIAYTPGYGVLEWAVENKTAEIRNKLMQDTNFASLLGTQSQKHGNVNSFFKPMLPTPVAAAKTKVSTPTPTSTSLKPTTTTTTAEPPPSSTSGISFLKSFRDMYRSIVASSSAEVDNNSAMLEVLPMFSAPGVNKNLKSSEEVTNPIRKSTARTTTQNSLPKIVGVSKNKTEYLGGYPRKEQKNLQAIRPYVPPTATPTSPSYFDQLMIAMDGRKFTTTNLPPFRPPTRRTTTTTPSSKKPFMGGSAGSSLESESGNTENQSSTKYGYRFKNRGRERDYLFSDVPGPIQPGFSQNLKLKSQAKIPVVQNSQNQFGSKQQFNKNSRPTTTTRAPITTTLTPPTRGSIKYKNVKSFKPQHIIGPPRPVHHPKIDSGSVSAEISREKSISTEYSSDENISGFPYQLPPNPKPLPLATSKANQTIPLPATTTTESIPQARADPESLSDISRYASAEKYSPNSKSYDYENLREVGVQGPERLGHHARPSAGNSFESGYDYSSLGVDSVELENNLPRFRPMPGYPVSAGAALPTMSSVSAAVHSGTDKSIISISSPPPSMVNVGRISPVYSTTQKSVPSTTTLPSSTITTSQPTTTPSTTLPTSKTTTPQPTAAPSTTLPPLTTTVSSTTLPPPTTTLPPSTSTLPPSTTTLSPSTTTLPPSTTTLSPPITTLPPSTTTLSPPITTLPPSTTTLAPSTTTLPPSTTTFPSSEATLPISTPEPPQPSSSPVFLTPTSQTVPIYTSPSNITTSVPSDEDEMVTSKRFEKQMSIVHKSGPSYSFRTMEIIRPIQPSALAPHLRNEDWIQEVALKALDRGISFQQVFSINIDKLLMRRTSLAGNETEPDESTTIIPASFENQDEIQGASDGVALPSSNPTLEIQPSSTTVAPVHPSTEISNIPNPSLDNIGISSEFGGSSQESYETQSHPDAKSSTQIPLYAGVINSIPIMEPDDNNNHAKHSSGLILESPRTNPRNGWTTPEQYISFDSFTESQPLARSQSQQGFSTGENIGLPPPPMYPEDEYDFDEAFQTRTLRNSARSVKRIRLRKRKGKTS